MTNSPLHSLDIRLLRYFAVVAEENNMSRAAQRLFMSQPPLSRHIRQLEERLGVVLFVRHTRGLTLTEDGVRVLETVRPLLDMQDKTYSALTRIAKTGVQTLRLGLSTAVEQGVFASLEARLRMCVNALHITRHGSPELVRLLRRGKIDAALVVLPLETTGLVVSAPFWQEPLIAALPACWPEAKSESLSLSVLHDRPLFWFKRERNPLFFDYARQFFQRSGYAPSCLEEPLEHDVLLARIANGDGMGLFASSFTAIQRQGVIFRPLNDTALSINVGLVMTEESAARWQWLNTLLQAGLR